MTTKIIEKKINRRANGYFLEITLSRFVDSIWQKSFQDAIKTETHTSMRSSGAPVVDNIEFRENKILTSNFPEFAKADLPNFLKELKHFIEVADNLYATRIRANLEQNQQDAQIEQDEEKKLAELNKWLDSIDN